MTVSRHHAAFIALSIALFALGLLIGRFSAQSPTLPAANKVTTVRDTPPEPQQAETEAAPTPVNPKELAIAFLAQDKMARKLFLAAAASSRGELTVLASPSSMRYTADGKYVVYSHDDPPETVAAAAESLVRLLAAGLLVESRTINRPDAEQTIFAVTTLGHSIKSAVSD